MPTWFIHYLASNGHLIGTEPEWFRFVIQERFARGLEIPGANVGIDWFDNWIQDPDHLAQLKLLALANAPAAAPAPAPAPAVAPAPQATPVQNLRVRLTQQGGNPLRWLTWPVALLILAGMIAFVILTMSVSHTGIFTPAGVGYMPSPSPTATVAPTATPTASPSPTATPTATPAPTPTPTASPSPSASPSGETSLGGKPLGTESAGCSDGLPVSDHNPQAEPGDYTVPCDGMYRAINYWDPKVPEYNRGNGQTNALFICYDQHVVFHDGGGSQYQWTHYGTALGNYQQHLNPQSNPAVKLSDLVAKGLATVTVNGGGVSVCDGGTPANAGSSTPPAGNNGGTSTPPTGNAPAMQDGCTTTNKQGTFSEFYGLGKDGYTPINEVQRIEVAGFSGWSEMDYYTLARDNSANGAHRVPTINYVFPPREALNGLVPIWFGNGSAWNYGTDTAQCNKDFALSWAKYYASQGAIEPGRLDNGNSGVVVDMQACMLYNTRSDLGWNRTNIQQLLDAHRASMTTTPCTTLVDSQDSTVTYDLTPGGHDLRGGDQALPTGPNSSGQCGVVGNSNSGGLLSHWTIKTTADQVAVVNYWNNKADPNPFYKFLLKPSSSVTLVGGGDVTFFPASCANSNVVLDGLHRLDKAKGQKLVDVSDIPSKYRR